MRKALGDLLIFVRNYDLWELKRDQYSSRVFRNFSKVIASVKRNAERQHPYTIEVTSLLDGHKLYRRAYLTTGPKTNKPVIALNPDAPRVAHINPSLKGDATGLAVGRIAEMVQVVRRAATGERTEVVGSIEPN